MVTTRRLGFHLGALSTFCGSNAKERAEREIDPSVRTTYLAMADDWAARLKDAEQEEDRKNEFIP
jgi:hypothetical protein